MNEQNVTPPARSPAPPDVTTTEKETLPDVTSSNQPPEGAPLIIETPPDGVNQYHIIPPEGTSSHPETPSEGTSLHLETPPDVTSSPLTAPLDVATAHLTTLPGEAPSRQATPPGAISLNRPTPQDIVMSSSNLAPLPVLTPPTNRSTFNTGGVPNDASQGGLVLQDYISEADLERSVVGTAVYKEQAMLMEEVPIELEALVPLKSFFLHKDESRRRTVFELRLIDGPLVLSAIDTNPCCFCSGNCQKKASSTRFLFDASNPVIQMLEEVHGCCSHRGVEICAPPYKYIGHVINTSSWVSFDLTVMGPHEEPLYFIKAKNQCSWWAGNDYTIFSYVKRLEVGNIYRRTDYGYRTGYTVYFPEYIPVKEKALLISATFFLDEVVGKGDSGSLGFCCF